MTARVFILAIGFVTPMFFAAGLLLASIPIIIHILNRRRFKTVQWAAMEFLLRALRKNRRRLKFEQWLLLATRCLVLLLFATALARPLACRDSTLASIAGQRSGLYVFVVDNSYSMAYEADRPDAKTHLDRARQLVKESIDRLQGGGEAVAIISAARPASAVIAPPTYDLQAAKSAVDRIEQSYSATDLLGALRAAQDVADREKGQPERNLIFVTDATRSAWEGSDAAAIKELGTSLAKTYGHITHYNLGKPNQWNQAALAIKSAGNLVTSRFNNDITATVQAFGSGAEPVLQWKLDDNVLPGGGNLKLTGEPQVITQPTTAFRSGGAHVVSTQLIGDDRLKIDNTRWRVLDVASELKVLIVEGERGMGARGGSGTFLELALAPPTETPSDTPGSRRSDSYVAPDMISDLELGNKVLGDYRAVILAGVGQISAAEADQLALFVKNGGALIIFMGEAVLAENYNQMLLSRGLMPGALTKRVAAGADQNGYQFDFNPKTPPPLLSAFKGYERSGLDTAQVYTYWQIELKPDAKAERVLDYLPAGDAKPAQRDPAITLHQLGQGHVVVVTTTADPNPEWNMLAAKPAYVALVHELLSGSVSSADRWMNLSAGEALMIPSSVRLSGTPTLTDASQKEIVLDPLPPGGAASFKSPPLKRPGVYRLSTGTATLPVVVNVPASDEADVRTIENSAIKRALGDINVDLAGDALPPVAAAADTAGSDFGWPLMLAGLLLIGGECFMAMRFGHYKR